MRLPLLGHLLAQAVILSLWAQDWRTGISGVFPDRVLMPEALVVALLGTPPALAVGVVEGRIVAGTPRASALAGALVATLLVLLAAWISTVGLLSLHLGFDTQDPPALVRVFVLFVVEVVFAVEALTALFTRRYLARM